MGQLKILCLNAGSSSLKYTLYEGERLLEQGDDEGYLSLDFDAVGHRIVFGGPCYKSEQITPTLLAKLTSLIPLAPLHLPPALALIDKIQQKKAVPQVACFDTAFFHNLPPLAQRFPLPDRFGLRRYGFHGLSYEYITSKYPKGNYIIAHLGSGASLAAVCDSKPIDTTMGLTPLGGLMMGTRPGDLDPGVLLYLLQTLSHQELSDLLEHDCGLKGVSGHTSDMKTLLKENSPAVDLFCYIARKHIGAMAVTLPSVDALIFTGGIGAHAPLIREKITKGLGYRILVEETDEDQVIATHVRQILGDLC